MAKRGSSERDNGELEFTRAGTDSLQDVAADLGMDYDTRITLTNQRGVLELLVVFYHCERKRGNEVVVRVSHTWPNSNGASFGAFFFQQVQKASLQARAWHIAWEEHERSRR